MSLRRRLVAGILLLLVAAVVVTDVVTYSSLDSFLEGRIDEQTDAAQEQVLREVYALYQHAAAEDSSVRVHPDVWLASLAQPFGTSGSPPLRGAFAGESRLAAITNAVSPDVYVEVIDPTGAVLFRRPSGTSDPAPLLPRHFPVQAVPLTTRFGAVHGPFFPGQPAFTTASASRATTYRAQAVALPGGTLVTAEPLAPTDATLASIVRVEAIVSVVVILAALLLALAVVRFALRPLEEMTEAAGAIAAGDLSRRVRGGDTSTEVGRLGDALNGMLAQIEAAFAERAGSEERLRRFIADASHELRTPLTSIRGYAELIRKGASGDEMATRRALERIESEAARMGLLVDDLLLLARLDQGRPLDSLLVDLAKIATEAVEAARTSDSGHPLSLVADGRAAVLGDPARLRQAVDNLVRNALVHTPDGTPVQVRVQAGEAVCSVSVSDEGPGLDPDEIDHVFERFYRADRARTRSGSGLGLSIVAAIASAHGGRVQVRSRRGAGATFTLEIPSQMAEEHCEPKLA